MIGMVVLVSQGIHAAKSRAAVRTRDTFLEHIFKMLESRDATGPLDSIEPRANRRNQTKNPAIPVLTILVGTLLNGSFCGGTGCFPCGATRRVQVAERLFSRMKEMNR
jgi:hypothetical protein